ncbi:CoA transferase [Paracoccus sp. R12_1]|uniref:CaiB/BaiF CoA transferase family protein n=1 Tax=unclassified Paracoccus (in: a-proteobacteria) TaxID=2688777 RepID=UPI001ADC1987|nr:MULTISPECIES: CoA transferase [unclassified Paracoccus (in: a-proteobacteria)]MBO9455835.1 CoA transferase [Paracoccus sp. R12_2]MBO9488476.1 CoA transferase [Paracoccus sp. R12_1]
MTTFGSLANLKVIDASRVLGGPYAGQVLADHGADVIKLEPPAGDETRGWGPPFLGDAASYFQGLNRNKRGIAVDLSQDKGRELLLALLDDADVLLENFKTGTMERWGLGQDELSRRFPRLIHCRVSGFGSDGPMGGLPGYDAAIQALCGIMSVNGEKDGQPLRVGVPVVDMVTGLNATIGILMALNERAISGKGQFIETSLYDCGVSLLHPHLPNYYLSGKVAQPSGNAHPNICPYDTFETGSEPIFLAVGNNRQFTTLCKMIGRPDLPDDPRFASNSQRNQHRDTLKTLLETALADFDAIELSDRLIKAGVPCGAVRSIDQVIDDPHTRHREMVVDIGGYRGTGSPIKLSRTPASYRRAPPSFAQHSAEVMEERALDPKEYRTVLPGLEDQPNAKRKA